MKWLDLTVNVLYDHPFSHSVSSKISISGLPALIPNPSWNNSPGARNNDACRRAGASYHTNKAIDAPAGSLPRIGSTRHEAFARTLHLYCTAVPPSARPTSEAGTGMAYVQVARPHHTGSGARRAQSEEDARTCIELLKAKIK